MITWGKFSDDYWSEGSLIITAHYSKGDGVRFSIT